MNRFQDDGTKGNRFEDLMSAISFAEAGEHEKARDILGSGKVLLVLLGKESDARSQRYAVSICKRIKAGLEVLCMAEAGKLKGILDEIKKEGVRFAVSQREGCIKKEILEVTGRMREVLFVVVESSEVLDLECAEEDGALSEAWGRLRCPLVLVSKNEILSAEAS